MADNQLLLRIEVQDDGSAVIKDFQGNVAKLEGEAKKASSGMATAFKSFRTDLNSAFTFSLGAMMASGLQSGVTAIKDFAADSMDEFEKFDAAMIGVEKTTGIPKDAAIELSEVLRQSAIDLKGLGDDAAVQMATITQVAGQLGIAQDKIDAGKFGEAADELAQYAEVIAKGKIALTEFAGGAEEVATKVAEISNIYRLKSTEAENILSVYNGLGDSLATDANKISNFMSSFTMGPQLKISFEEAAGIAATLTSMGLDAGAAATNYQGAISQILQGTERTVEALNTAITGSESAQQHLTEIVGRSKTETESFYDYFKQALAVDAVAATNSLIDAIGELPDSVTQTQTSLDIFGREGARTMNALIGNTDKLNENIGKSKTLYAEHTSIQREYDRAIGKATTSLDEMKTRTEDLQISVGKNLTQAINNVAQTSINPLLEEFRQWMTTSQEAKTLFETTIPGAIKLTAGALEWLAETLSKVNESIVTAANWWGEKIADLEMSIQDNAQANEDAIAAAGNVFAEGMGVIVDGANESADALKTQSTAAQTAEKELVKLKEANLDLLRTDKDLRTEYQAVARELGNAIDSGIAPSEELINRMEALRQKIKAVGVEAYGNSTFPDMTASIRTSGGATTELTGKMDTLRASVEELDAEFQQSYAENLAQGMNALRQATEEAAAAQAEANAEFQQSYAEDLAYGLYTLRDAYEETYEAAEYPEAALLSMRSATGIIQEQEVTLGDLATAAEQAAGSFGKLSSGIGSIGDLFGFDTSGIENILGKAQQFAELPKVFSEMKDAIGGIGEAFGKLKGFDIKNIFSGGAGGLSGIISSLSSIAPIAGIIMSAWGPIKDFFSGLFENTKSKGTEAALAMQDFVTKGISGGAELASAMGSAFDVMTANNFDFQASLQASGSTMSQVMGGISANWQQGATAMDIFTVAVGKATGDMQKAPQVALQMMMGFDSMGLSAEQAGAKMLEIAQAAGLSDAQLQQLQGALGGAASGAETFAATAEQAAATTKASVDSVTSLSGSLGNAAKSYASAADAAREFAAAQAQTAMLQKMQGLASGGFVQSGLAIVNEAGSEIARFPGGGMALMTAPGPALAVLPVGTEVIPHSRSMQILREYPGLPRMATGGTIDALPAGNISVSIGQLVVQGQLGNSSDMRRMADDLSREIAARLQRRR